MGRRGGALEGEGGALKGREANGKAREVKARTSGALSRGGGMGASERRKEKARVSKDEQVLRPTWA